MSTIDSFIETIKSEYQEGAYDERVPLGEFVPKILETNDYLGFYLERISGTLFDEKGNITETDAAPSALNLNSWSFLQYCRRIKPEGSPLTADYIKDCSPSLATHNLTTWVKVNAEKEVFMRFKKEENGRVNIRAVLSGLWTPIDAGYVAGKLYKFLGKEPIEYTVTDKFWRILRWTDSKYPYKIGFRIMGSEVGAIPYLRIDTVIGFPIGKTNAVVPILKEGKPIGRMSYNSSGSKASNKLLDSIHKGLSQTKQLTGCLDQRQEEPLKYPQDEFIEITENRGLPAAIKSAVTERVTLFEGVENKLDMVKLLSTLANETSGFTQIKIEEAAALYALTGRSRDRVNRNEEDWEGA